MFYKMYCNNYNFQCLDTNFYGNFSDNLKSEDSFLKKDIRTFGSGNIGTTNVLRTGNKFLAVGTLVLDLFKGYISVYITIFY